MEGTENQVSKSKKDLFLKRMKTKRPDLNFEDEDSVYGSINDDYDEADAYRKKTMDDNKKVTDFLQADGKNAAMFMKIMQGEDIAVALLEEYGDDFREALDDPDKAEKIAEANKKYQERVLKSKEFDEQAEANLQSSMDALTEAQKALGVDDEIVNKAFEAYAQMVNDAILNKVSIDTWKMFINGLSYDEDVQNAEREGEVRGRNAKIDMMRKKQSGGKNTPPVLNGQGVANPVRGRRKPSIDGPLGSVGAPDIYERGGMKKE